MNDNLDISVSDADETINLDSKDKEEYTQCENDIVTETSNFNEPTIKQSEQCGTIINNYKIFNTYGDNPNFVVAENIENSSIQGETGSNGVSNNPQDEIVPIVDEKSFEKYINRFKNTNKFVALIAIASLGKIEETNFDYVCNKLKKYIDKIIQPSDEDKYEDSLFESRTSLLKSIFSTRVTIKRNTHTGLINTNCICFTDETLSMKIRKWIWCMYPQFRDIIIDWLIELSNINKWFLCAMAQNGIAEYATIDFEYSLDKIFAKLYKNPNYSEISTLAFVIEKLYEKNICEANLDKMLLNWFGYENNDLWMVSFRLCAKGYANKCNEKITEVLNKHIFIPNYRNDRYFLYIMGFAHRSKLISEKLINVLHEHFEKQKLKSQKDQTAKIFLWLMMYDFFATDENYPNLIFVDCANTLELRKQMRPIVQHILGNFQLRTELYELLNAFLIEYKVNSNNWAPVEKFIRELAFTGKKQDFDRTVNWLEKNRKHKQLFDFSEYMMIYLNKTLSRKKQKEY